MIEIKSEMDLTQKAVVTGTYVKDTVYKFRKSVNPTEEQEI